MNVPVRYLLILLVLLAGAGAARAQNMPAGNGFPVPYGASNMGRNFWAIFPANGNEGDPSSVRLYLTAAVRARVTIAVGFEVKKVIYTIPNDIISIDLSLLEAQAFTHADNPGVPNDSTYRFRAVSIRAEAPVAVYARSNTLFSSEGLLLLPESSLGREYIIPSYGGVGSGLQNFPSQYTIASLHKGTIVTISHPSRTPNHDAGQTFAVPMDSLDVFSAMTNGPGGDMSGVVIRSNKPIAVTAGQECAYIPNLVNVCCCNHITEMLLPTESWGKVYHGFPIQTKLKGDIYRIFAKEAATRISINGAPYAMLSTVGGTEGNGWVEYRALGKGVQEFIADKPILVMQYSTTSEYDDTETNPFYMTLAPLEQYQVGMLFCTPSVDAPMNYINVVSDKDGYADLEITPANKDEWKPFSQMNGVGTPKEYPTTVNGRKYVGVSTELRPGVYRMRGKRPFAVYLYNPGTTQTYGYPGALGTRDLSKGDVVAPAITRTVDCSGSVAATATDLPADALLRTNLSSIELDPDAAATSNYTLIVPEFQPGAAAVIQYTLRVTDITKPARAIVIISDMAGNVTYDTITYGPLNVVATPSPRDYGKVRVGDRVTKTVTFSNRSSDAVEIREVVLKSGATGFRILSPTSKFFLGPQGSPSASVDVTIEFTAALIGTDTRQIHEDSVGVVDACGTRYLGLVRTQVVKPMIRVTDHDFGVQQVLVESGAPWQMEVRNTSPIEGSTLTVTAHTGPNHNTPIKIFDVKSGTALAVPFTLEPNQTRDLLITATAPDLQVHYDTIFFESDAIDVAEGDDYGWLKIAGVALAGVDAGPDAAGAITAMDITPNPAGTDAAVLKYSLAHGCLVSIDVVDGGGRMIRAIQSAVMQQAGGHEMKMDLAGLAAGTYYVQVAAGNVRSVKRMVIVR